VAKTGPDADIAAKAHPFLTLVDLAGHKKYLKTAVHGVSSGMIDYALVLVSSRQPPTHMTRHLAVACNIPIFHPAPFHNLLSSVNRKEGTTSGVLSPFGSKSEETACAGSQQKLNH